MAIRWNWDEKCGEATLVQTIEGEEKKEFTLSLYTGNCYLIFLHEFERDGEQRYNLHTFFADKNHMNRCLGIGKYKDQGNILNEGWSKITKFRINKKQMIYWKQIVPALIQAFDNIEMEFYTE